MIFDLILGRFELYLGIHTLVKCFSGFCSFGTQNKLISPSCMLFIAAYVAAYIFAKSSREFIMQINCAGNSICECVRSTVCVTVCLKTRPKHPQVRRWWRTVHLTNTSCAPNDVSRSHAPLPNDTRVGHLQEWLFTSLLFVLALPANQQSLQLLSHARLICFAPSGTVYEESHIEHCCHWERVIRDV